MTKLCAFSLSLMMLFACAGDSTRGGSNNVARHESIRVLAASSLSEALTDLAHAFERSHPGTTVEVSFGGSPGLVAQILQGAPADVFASADTTNMRTLAGLTTRPVDFARNTMTIGVQRGNPKHVLGLQQLAQRGLIVVLCRQTVPCGKLTARILTKAKITLRPASLEDNVKGVVTKIRTGDADAGLVYVTDARAEERIQAIPIAPSDNEITTYPIARLRSSKRRALADAFIVFVTSTLGQARLARFGFLPRA